MTGLGNIYVDEALWEAKIHPEQSAATLNEAEIDLLHRAIIDVLARAVEAGGTTIRTYLNALGEAGHFQVSLHVYGQTGNPCVRCGTPDRKNKSCTTRDPLLSILPAITRGDRKMSLVVGVTGGIATGKSTVVKCFEEAGIPIIDADIVAREVVEPGMPGLEKIKTVFGPEVINPDGTLARKKIRKNHFCG